MVVGVSLAPVRGSRPGGFRTYSRLTTLGADPAGRWRWTCSPTTIGSSAWQSSVRERDGWRCPLGSRLGGGPIGRNGWPRTAFGSLPAERGRCFLGEAVTEWLGDPRGGTADEALGLEGLARRCQGARLRIYPHGLELVLSTKTAEGVPLAVLALLAPVGLAALFFLVPPAGADPVQRLFLLLVCAAGLLGLWCTALMRVAGRVEVAASGTWVAIFVGVGARFGLHWRMRCDRIVRVEQGKGIWGGPPIRILTRYGRVGFGWWLRPDQRHLAIEALRFVLARRRVVP